MPINYDDIPYLVPTDNQAEANYTSTVYVRQNPWKTDTYNPYITLHSKKLHIPFAHSPTITTENAPQQSQLGIALEIGDIIVCAYRECALLVRITSGVKQGVVEPICIAIDPEKHYQNPAEYASGVKGFMLKSPYEVGNDETVDGIKWALENNYIIEPFYSLYRDIEIIGEITDVSDWRKIVGMSSSGKRINHFKLKPRVYANPSHGALFSITFGYIPDGEDIGPLG